jgi:hypothetical protein
MKKLLVLVVTFTPDPTTLQTDCNRKEVMPI